MRVLRRVALRPFSCLAFGGFLLFPTAISFQDAAAFAAPDGAPRWLSYFATAPQSPAVTNAAELQSPSASNGFIIRSAAPPEVWTRKREYAPLPPSLAARFAIAFPPD